MRTDSLYGMKTFFLVNTCSDKAEMTFPSVSRDLLMLAPSCNDRKVALLGVHPLQFSGQSQKFKKPDLEQTILYVINREEIKHRSTYKMQEADKLAITEEHEYLEMLTLSLSPLVWAELQRSLPARSTRLILLVMLWSCSSPSTNSV